MAVALCACARERISVGTGQSPARRTLATSAPMRARYAELMARVLVTEVVVVDNWMD